MVHNSSIDTMFEWRFEYLEKFGEIVSVIADQFHRFVFRVASYLLNFPRGSGLTSAIY
jgi:hypothetical protein